MGKFREKREAKKEAKRERKQANAEQRKARKQEVKNNFLGFLSETGKNVGGEVSKSLGGIFGGLMKKIPGLENTANDGINKLANNQLSMIWEQHKWKIIASIGGLFVLIAGGVWLGNSGTRKRR